jgi:HlyD family secretion protein
VTRLTKILIGAGVVAVLGTVVAVSMRSGDKEKGTEVYMADAKEKDLLASVTATGRIQPRTKVEVQSSVIGEIVKLPVKDGDRVKRGQLLVQIDPERYRAEVERLEANLRMARIEIEREEASLANSRSRCSGTSSCTARRSSLRRPWTRAAWTCAPARSPSTA